MKTHRFNIAQYFEPEGDGTDNIYIDWPAVHRQAGVDHVQWLKQQDPTQCQLVVEQRPYSGYTHLIAEIYSDRLATLYSLMWAK